MYLELETIGGCNRHCKSCLRNSIVERDLVSSWFQNTILPIKIIKGILQQSIRITDEVCLSHYDEPLLDKRIAEIAKLAIDVGFRQVFLFSNGDLLTEEIASTLDGILSSIYISLYEPNEKKINSIKSFFNITKVEFNPSQHIPTHFSPLHDVINLADKNRNYPCYQPNLRLVINHKGQYLLCCEDLIGRFDLGKFPETSVEEFWFSKKRENIARLLSETGGRMFHSYCSTCPRP